MAEQKHNKEEKIVPAVVIGCAYAARCCPLPTGDLSENCEGLHTRLPNGKIVIECSRC